MYKPKKVTKESHGIKKGEIIKKKRNLFQPRRFLNY